MAEIELGDSGHKHTVGNKDCAVDWCGGIQGWPKPCPDCGTGLVHAAFGDENFDGDYWLYMKCDNCGETHFGDF